MKANIVVTLEGDIQIITQEGTFEGGKERLEELMARLKASGISINNPTFEQHRHDDEAHVHAHVHAHAGGGQ